MTTCLVTAAIPRTIDLFLGPHMQRLRELGFDVHIATSGTPEVAEQNGFPCHRIEFSRSPFNVVAHFRAWRSYRRLLDQLTTSGEPVILHLHTPIAAALARLALRRSHPARVLYMAHGLHFLPGEKNVYYWIERALAHLTDLFVLINEADLQSAKALCADDAARVVKIPGVGLQRTFAGNAESSPDAARAPEHVRAGSGDGTRRKVIVVGVLEPRKHPELAIRAAALLDDSVDVHMIGDGPLETELRALAVTLGCDHRVHFEGWTDEVWKWFTNADCLMFLSEREGLPMTVAESLAAAVPVVAFDIRGVRDLLDGLDGWYIPQGRTPDAVAGAVSRALQEPIDTASWHRQAQNFTLEASLQAHDTAIANLATGFSDHHLCGSAVYQRVAAYAGRPSVR